MDLHLHRVHILVYITICHDYMTLTGLQFNLSATVSRSLCQVDDRSGRTCQQDLVCSSDTLHFIRYITFVQ